MLCLDWCVLRDLSGLRNPIISHFVPLLFIPLLFYTESKPTYTSQWILILIKLCRCLYSFCAILGHSLSTWLPVSSAWPHVLHLLSFCDLWFSALIAFNLMSYLFTTNMMSICIYLLYKSHLSGSAIVKRTDHEASSLLTCHAASPYATLLQSLAQHFALRNLHPFFLHLLEEIHEKA